MIAERMAGQYGCWNRLLTNLWAAWLDWVLCSVVSASLSLCRDPAMRTAADSAWRATFWV